MSVTFIHTADWQIGKPFAGIADVQKRALLQNERVAVLRRIADQARERGAEFVLLAGDLFDSPSATRSTVSAACSAIGSIGIPVFAIPGNHDHGGPGSLWEQEFFKRERDQLAPNLTILLEPGPVELPNAVLFPCPLLRRHEPTDPTAWLRSLASLDERFGTRPRIILAHGSVQGFDSLPDLEEPDAGAINRIDLPRVPQNAFDYIALGDWHGTRQVGDKAWYAGTPELDRFVKGQDHDPGNILVVQARRGQLPQVERARTGLMGWHEIVFTFADDASVGRLQELVEGRIGARANQDLLQLHLGGSLGIEASTRLEALLETWQARLLRVKLDSQTSIAPSPSELEALTRRPDAPLVSRVADKLVTLAAGADEQAAIARIALRELHAATNAH